VSAKARSSLPASFASIVLLAAPAVSAVSAWLLFGEALTQFTGGALMLAGLAAASLSEAQRSTLDQRFAEPAR
jgi:drug/metabolite transporter (DMT)-like permease